MASAGAVDSRRIETTAQRHRHRARAAQTALDRLIETVAERVDVLVNPAQPRLPTEVEVPVSTRDELLWRDDGQMRGRQRRHAVKVRRREVIVECVVREQTAQRLGAARLVQQLRHTELSLLMDALRHTKVLLLKGAGLAYTVYPEPHLRPRLDVDLFVKRNDVDETHRSLVRRGYAREPAAALADFERSYSRVDASGLEHHADLHWGVANPAPFANVLPFDKAWESSIPVEALGPTARTLGHTDALLLACVHRVAHHRDSPNLLWLWDIHLLANRLTAAAWDTLVGNAEDAGMRAVTYRGLELTRQNFGTSVPADVVERLRPSGRSEPAARFIRGLRLSEIAMTDLVQ